jgi:hypothetical protein
MLDEQSKRITHPILAALVAETGLGKTMALCAAATSAAMSGLRVILVSGEMAYEELFGRIVSNQTQSPIAELVESHLAEFRVRLSESGGELGIVDRHGLGDMSVDRLVEMSASYEVTIVDNSDLLGIGTQGNEAHERLRQAVEHEQRSFWVGVQLSRELYGRAWHHQTVQVRDLSDTTLDSFDVVLGMSQTATERDSSGGPFVNVFFLRSRDAGRPSVRAVRYRTLFGANSPGITRSSPTDCSRLTRAPSD